ncbi:hypothetical protein [Thiomicrorhabdus chilensis]|uniref:hypothetical protein n=1 Tax=Thiomicrorhabdus chilensis TaxID=63656 RepID=UPI000423800F|nr:hypothetical protein [Thiomicrorhabdus chilensis]
MNVSIDISMYPLNEQYCQPILDFINQIEQNPKLKIERNAMSTQVFGDYRTVMAEISEEMLIALEKLPTTVFVLKLVGTDRSNARIRSCE